MVIGIMWPTSQSHYHLLFIFIEMNFYSMSFLCVYPLKYVMIK